MEVTKGMRGPLQWHVYGSTGHLELGCGRDGIRVRVGRWTVM